jgi:hypothetical protein
MNPLSLIPAPYRLVASIGLGLVLLTGVWFHGYEKGSARADREIAAFVTKHVTVDNTLQKINNKLTDSLTVAVLKKVDTITMRKVKNVEVTKEVPGPVVTVHDTVTRIELPIGWVYTHDASAGGYDADSAYYTNGAASGFTPNDALRYVVSNYAICQENAETLRALQEWVRQNRHIVDSLSKKP